MDSASATNSTKNVTKVTTHDGVVKIMKNARHFKYSHKYHTYKDIVKHHCGDCWAMSAYLYESLKRYKIHARIIQYKTHWSARHRSVQYRLNNHWYNMPYRTYFYTNMFNNTKSSGLVITKC